MLDGEMIANFQYRPLAVLRPDVDWHSPKRQLSIANLDQEDLNVAQSMLRSVPTNQRGNKEYVELKRQVEKHLFRSFESIPRPVDWHRSAKSDRIPSEREPDLDQK
jgi:hypothetical protein